MKAVALWALALALMILGFIGTVAPALPGVLLIFAGMLLAAWIDGFARVGAWTLALLGALTVLSFIADALAGLLGARRVGASPLALIGSVVGGLVGLPLGLVGIFLGPLVGAAVGELLMQRKLHQAARVGMATFIGQLLGSLAKMGIAVTMLCIFATSYFLF